jgi:UrcA family protein
MKIFAPAAAAIAFAALALPAAAQAKTPATPSIHVSYADLDLHKAAGVKALDRRLAQAVRTLCAEGATDLTRQLAARRCIVATTAALAAARERAIAGDTGFEGTR